MPLYEFQCQKCNETFTKKMSISEMEKTKVRCPKCKSQKVKKVISGFYSITSKKS
ncbi:zinc ribbon domain-containing protein [Thermodesulfovibrio sp. 3907-1M]|uniref:Zinc ribbon domain-containing protein n=1 Tax=Thermodesulfovibrio autotrophicus TaxID=3118333 RepID=A0AAU8GUN6_9BACT